jgi:hypothetical protein
LWHIRQFWATRGRTACSKAEGEAAKRPVIGSKKAGRRNFMENNAADRASFTITLK